MERRLSYILQLPVVNSNVPFRLPRTAQRWPTARATVDDPDRPLRDCRRSCTRDGHAIPSVGLASVSALAVGLAWRSDRRPQTYRGNKPGTLPGRALPARPVRGPGPDL